MTSTGEVHGAAGSDESELAAAASGWILEDPVVVEAEPSQLADMTAAAASSSPRETLRVEAALEFPVIAPQACELQAVLSVIAPRVTETARAPLRLVAVLDKSGSMNGEKLRLVVKTMRFMLRHLSERDALGLVVYDTEVRVLAPLTRCDVDGRQRLDQALAGIGSGSQTNLSGGLLRGFRVHLEQVPDETAQAPLQRVRFGNTYRRLSEEEAAERPHFGTADPPSGCQRVHEWALEMRFESEEDEALLQKVVYTLHDSFRDPVVEVFEAPYRLTRFGWGTFVVRAEIHLADGRRLELEHELCFSEPESFRIVLLPLRVAPTFAPSVAAEPHDAQAVVRATFLFTDGLANCGIRNPEQLIAAAVNALDEMGARRCTLSTFGFGSDHQEGLLQELAKRGGGVYSYVESEDRIGEAFGEALGGLLSTTHQDVRLRLDLAPGVLASALTDLHVEVEGGGAMDDSALEAGGGYLICIAGRALSVDLGDLFAEERRDVLLTFTLPEAEAEGTQALGRVLAQGFSVLGLQTEKTECLSLSVDRRAGGAAAVGATSHAQVERHRNRYITSEALRAARLAAARCDLTAARERLSAVAEILSASALTAAGDPISAGLLVDVNECLANLRSQSEFRDKGSKKMAMMERAHVLQRGCGDAEQYSNPTSLEMKYAFKDSCQ